MALQAYVGKVEEIIDDPIRDPTYGWIVLRAALLGEVVAAPRLCFSGRVAEALALRARFLPQVPRWYPHFAQRVLVAIAEGLADLGRNAEAYRFAQRARGYDPANTWAIGELGRAALGLGRLDEARAAAAVLASRETPDDDLPKALRALGVSAAEEPLPHARPTQLSEQEYYQGIAYADYDNRIHPEVRLRQHAIALRLRGHAARALDVAREVAASPVNDAVGRHVGSEHAANYQQVFGGWSPAVQHPWHEALVRCLEAEARDAPTGSIPYVASEPQRLTTITAAIAAKDSATLVEAFCFWPGRRVRTASAEGLSLLDTRSMLPALERVAGFERECGRAAIYPSVGRCVDFLRASPYPDASMRGVALVARAIDGCRAKGLYSAKGKPLSPKPLPPETIAKLRLPGDRPLSPSMKAWLAFDGGRLGWSKKISPVLLAELVPKAFEKRARVPAWLNGACIPLLGGLKRDAFLYVGEPDDLGEYPVLAIAQEDDDILLTLRTPSFDVYLAESFGVLDFGPSRAKHLDWAEAARVPTLRNLRGKLDVSLLRPDQ